MLYWTGIQWSFLCFSTNRGYFNANFWGYDSNPPSANFFRLLCSVCLPQKVRVIFALKMKKTDSGEVWLTNPKPVFLKFIELSDIFAPNVWKLPDLSGRQIRQFIWRRVRDSNPRDLSVYSISSAAPSTTRTTLRIYFHPCFLPKNCSKIRWGENRRESKKYSTLRFSVLRNIKENQGDEIPSFCRNFESGPL